MGHHIWPYKQRQTYHIIKKQIKPEEVREHTPAYNLLTLKLSPLAENLEKNISLVFEIFTQYRNPLLLNDVINTFLQLTNILQMRIKSQY